MIRPTILVAALLASLAGPPALLPEAANEVRMVEVTGDGAKYWSRWRGPSGQGHSREGKYTDPWSATDSVKWKVAVPGSGNSSPIVWKDRIFLTTAEENGSKLSLRSYTRSDGKRLWQSLVPQEGTETVHAKNGSAS